MQSGCGTLPSLVKGKPINGRAFWCAVFTPILATSILDNAREPHAGWRKDRGLRTSSILTNSPVTPVIASREDASMRRLGFPIVTMALFFSGPLQVDARLPRPERAQGVILAIDPDTQTIVFKGGKQEKPLLLNWNVRTEFRSNDRPISPAKIKPGDNVIVSYKRISFSNPLLKQLILLPRKQRE